MSVSVYRRMHFLEFGQPDVFQWAESSIRDLEPDEVVIRVKYIGVNFADIIARRGYYKWAGKPPICPGFEVSGVIEAKGKEVEFPLGTRVLAVTRFGGYAEVLVAKKKLVKRLPEGMTFEEAAALPTVYVTAYHCLKEIMRAKSGEDIFIQAVAGGIGIAALQISKYKGLTVYGTAGSDEKLEFAKSFGLDYGINYNQTDFEKVLLEKTQGEGVKFILDSLGGYGLRKGMRCLKPGGHAVTIGAAGVLPPSGLNFGSLKEWRRIGVDLIKGGYYHPFSLIEHNVTLSGLQILLLWDRMDYLAGLIDELIELYRIGAIRPHIDKIFPLEKASQAHTYMEQRKSKGKILLTTDHA